MKKYVYLAMLLLCSAVLFTACGDDDEEVIDEAWKTENEQAFQEIASNSAYTKIQAQSSTNMGKVVYKRILKEGTGKKIFFNSRVDVYYKGWLVDGTSYNQRLFEDGVPYQVAVSSTVANYSSSSSTGYMTCPIEGWSTALQTMKEGEKAEIWIPQELGYGSISYTEKEEIPAYSTLKIEIEVVKTYTYGIDF
ncbi:FKBP-type peptidyl-prolyl cis-trans isomerase [Parabacteroides sp. Marseille-P3160]|uniref:FKBP-type peptidyl-prolyl cis-trans isomerase n=1 Tax=Parabacteroides sp. Marseille-P3160 TaxID=1917887 RepID=UPI0009B9E809|nr:FKBP-type peptidyl-prolyl cis-trans isomerase [Parabacteroides sp. Marseille-P3160]